MKRTILDVFGVAFMLMSITVQAQEPQAPTSQEDIQESFVRENEIDPALYYPKGYHPELLQEWPVEGDLVVPLEDAPKDMTDGMGQSWELKKKNQKILDEKKAGQDADKKKNLGQLERPVTHDITHALPSRRLCHFIHANIGSRKVSNQIASNAI